MNTLVTHARLPSAAPGNKVKHAPDPDLAIEVLSEYSALCSMQQVWDALVKLSDIPHPFLGHAWICAWWDSFGAGKQLHVLLIRDVVADGRIIGIVPLMLGYTRICGFRFLQLSFLHNDHTPRSGVIGGAEPERISRRLWNYLHTEHTHWDVLMLAPLPDDSSMLQHLPPMARSAGYSVGLWQGEISPFVPLDEEPASYGSHMSHNLRINVRQRMNRLARVGEVRLEIIDTPAQILTALDDGLRIEAAAWKAQAGTAISVLPSVKRFYVQLARSAAREGTLRLLFLTVSGKRIAFGYALCQHNRLFALKSGYDPQYACYSPYNLLCFLLLQDSCARGLDEYDFLGRDEVWKMQWTQQTRAHRWLYIFVPGWRAQLAYQTKFRWIPTLQRQPVYLLVRASYMRSRQRVSQWLAQLRNNQIKRQKATS